MSRNCSVALRLWFVAGGRSRCQVLAQCQAGNQLLEGPAKLQQHTRGTGAVGTQSETPALADRQAALDGNLAYLRLYARAKGVVDAVNLKAETRAEQSGRAAERHHRGITGASQGRSALHNAAAAQGPRAPGPQRDVIACKSHPFMCYQGWAGRGQCPEPGSMYVVERLS